MLNAYVCSVSDICTLPSVERQLEKRNLAAAYVAALLGEPFFVTPLKRLLGLRLVRSVC